MNDVVRRILAAHYRPIVTPSWLTLLGHTKDSLWIVDLYRCESILLNSHWVLVIMDQFARRIIGFDVHAGNVDGIALCCMFNQASSGVDVPKYLSSDNDPLFRYHRWKANLRIREVDEIKTAPHVPLSHRFIKRLIGTIHRGYLDRIFFCNAHDLERKLLDFKQYHNRGRVHQSLHGATPAVVNGETKICPADLEYYLWRSHCNGLFQIPVAD